jgi:hypothetical protein
MPDFEKNKVYARWHKPTRPGGFPPSGDAIEPTEK